MCRLPGDVSFDELDFSSEDSNAMLHQVDPSSPPPPIVELESDEFSDEKEHEGRYS